MAKRNSLSFTRTIEWSDKSEHSPSITGNLPDFVVLDGKRIECDTQSVMVAQYNANAIDWVKLTPEISARVKSWGDPGDRSYGRAGTRVEIIAPESATFLYEHRCAMCKELLYIDADDGNYEEYCKGCEKILAEEEREREEAYAACKEYEEQQDLEYRAWMNEQMGEI